MFGVHQMIRLKTPFHSVDIDRAISVCRKFVKQNLTQNIQTAATSKPQELFYHDQGDTPQDSTGL
ncbi:Protein of unknown function [Pyronema omphalodes CBS 100304]|uniref:Uncharacterized protein n=1 Tax=Pyronema omphalodes (strain CBS 100304) TaxID=1076935 RepID=U4KTZ3_PYROM|nr:Protein of unknown function [Pyronema omphalodes CBS 100304]